MAKREEDTSEEGARGGGGAPGDAPSDPGEGSPPGSARGLPHAEPPDPEAAPRASEPPADEGRTDEQGADGSGSEDGPPLLAPGNPPRWVRGGALALGGALPTVLLLALTPRAVKGGGIPHADHRFAVPLAVVGVLVTLAGVLDLAGSFDEPDERLRARADLDELKRALLVLASGGLGIFAALRFSVSGVLGPHGATAVVPATFLLAVVGGYRVLEALGVFRSQPLGGQGERLALHQRHGFWLVGVVTLLYLPRLGTHALIDPWETHYGEVSREILARGDWISLWWAQDGWFWSKPILLFWLQALSMSLLGVRYEPGEMLAGAASGTNPWPEWALRFPIFLLVLVATYLLYKATARAFGRRAGLFGALALSSMPQWFLVGHQTVTDMPFVAPLAACLAFVALGAQEEPEREAPCYEVAVGSMRLRLSAWHAVMGAILLVAIPQILYLLSRNLDIATAPLRIKVKLDAFWQGSGMGNCGLPGNVECKPMGPELGRLHPALQALLWAQGAGVLVWLQWGERRLQRLYFLAAWLCAALASMGKGPAGLVLPVAAALAWLFASGRLRTLARFELPGGLLVFAIVALPWFVAMYARHGGGFTDRLLFHDIYKRAFAHVHDTNEGDDVSFRYYVWQLGYATFPLVGLVPAGLLQMVEGGRRGGQATIRVLFGFWFLLTFCLFAFMGTKFHHYVLPAVPAAGVLTGVLLERISRSGDAEPYERAILGAAALAGALLVVVVGLDLCLPREGQPSQARLLHLFAYNYRRAWPPTLDFHFELQVFTAAGGLATALLVVPRLRRFVAPGLLVLGLFFAGWGLHRYLVRTSPHWGQRELVVAYHKANVDAAGPLISYQQNWKGENFYTGNQIPAFVTSGKKFTDHMAELKRKGHRTFYFLLEPSRMTTLSTELGGPRVFERLVPPEVNNKFTLVRAKFD